MAVAQVRAGANYGGYFTKGYYGTYPRGSAPARKTFSPFLSKTLRRESGWENFHLYIYANAAGHDESAVREGARGSTEIVHAATMIIPLTHSLSASRSTPYLHLQRAPLLYARGLLSRYIWLTGSIVADDVFYQPAISLLCALWLGLRYIMHAGGDGEAHAAPQEPMQITSNSRVSSAVLMSSPSSEPMRVSSTLLSHHRPPSKFTN